MKNFRQQQQHRPKKSLLITGRKAVLDSIGSDKELERIYLQNTAYGSSIEEITKKAADYKIPINKVPVEKLNSFNISNHEGVVALISKIQYQDLQQVISFVVDQGRPPLLLILDGITDIRNIGAIARTAYCCGVDCLVIPDKGVGTLNEDAISTSAGALEKIAVSRVSSLMKTVDDLHLNGIKVFAADMSAECKVYQLELKEPCAIIMGSEEKGITPALMKICDDQFSIPMQGDFESLNVSVATGIALYEAMKQRLQSITK